VLKVAASTVNDDLPLAALRREGRGSLSPPCGERVRVRGLNRMRGANVTKTRIARRLRRNSTTAEKLLWKYLRSRSLDGFKFVRQEPIGPHVVDFVCRQRRLVIEVDGSQHAIGRRDAIRDRWFIDHRYRVLRFWNNEVLGNIEGVWETILTAALRDRPPHPNPLPVNGEREVSREGK